MGTLISIAIVIVCILLILIVLVQNSKGGGLASSFSSSNQVMGVRKTGDFLEKATWSLAIALFVLCVFSAAYTRPSDGINNTTKTESATRKVGANEPAAAPVNAPAPAAPVTPAPAPQLPK